MTLRTPFPILVFGLLFLTSTLCFANTCQGYFITAESFFADNNQDRSIERKTEYQKSKERIQNYLNEAVTYEAYLTSPDTLETQQIPVSLSFTNKLSLLSLDGTHKYFPTELIRITPPGNELRIYFNFAGLSSRLIVRRNFDGSWSFGHPPLELPTITESYIYNGPYSPHVQYPTSIYTLNESQQLSQKISYVSGVTLAQKLSENLKAIRLQIEKNIYYQGLSVDLKRILRESFPDGYSDLVYRYIAEAHFDLQEGLIKNTPSDRFNGHEKMILAAIHYILDKDLIFLTKGSKDLKAGIYPRKDTQSSRFHAVTTNFEVSLLQAMKHANLQYDNIADSWAPSN